MKSWLTFGLLCLTASCGGNSSSTEDAAKTPDAIASIDAALDAPGVPVFPCGSVINGTWQRCTGDAIYRPGRTMPDGNIELSVGDPDVMYDSDERLWKAWWSTGAAATPTSTVSQVHLMYAESADGIAWTVQAEPVLKSGQDPTNWDNSKIETPTVIKVPGNPATRRYVMFYAGGNDVDFPQTAMLAYTWYQIGVAFSPDGKHFTRMPASESPYAGQQTGFRKIDGLFLMARDAFPGVANVENGVVADPEAVFDGTNYQLFFSSLASKADRTTYLAYGISHLTLTSLATPARTIPTGNPVLSGAAQPSIVKTPSGYELFAIYDSATDSMMVPSVFNQYYGIWKHSSTDLQTFSAKAAQHEFSMAGAPAGEKLGMVKAGDMVYVDGIYHYYYPAFRSDRVPTGFYCPVQHGSVTPLPAGSIENISPGVDLVPGIISLHVAARR